MRILLAACAAAVTWAGIAAAQPAADTVAAIRARGQLLCGVSVNAAGFALSRWHAATKGDPFGPAISPLVHSISG